MKKYLYHTTPSVNTESILENGLIRRGAFICLSEGKSSWFVPKQTLFQVDIEKYMNDNPNVKVTTWLPESDEICVWADIDRKYITPVKISKTN